MPSHAERVRRNYPEGVPDFCAVRSRRLDAVSPEECLHYWAYSPATCASLCLRCGLVVTDLERAQRGAA